MREYGILSCHSHFHIKWMKHDLFSQEWLRRNSSAQNFSQWQATCHKGKCLIALLLFVAGCLCYGQFHSLFPSRSVILLITFLSFPSTIDSYILTISRHISFHWAWYPFEHVVHHSRWIVELSSYTSSSLLAIALSVALGRRAGRSNYQSGKCFGPRASDYGWKRLRLYHGLRVYAGFNLLFMYSPWWLLQLLDTRSLFPTSKWLIREGRSSWWRSRLLPPKRGTK